MSNIVKVDLQASQSFTPFPHADLDAEFVGAEDFVSIAEMESLIRRRMAVDYNFSGAISVGTLSGGIYDTTGFRAGLYGMGNDPGFRWLTFITGFSGGMSGGTNNWEYREDSAAKGITPGSPSWSTDPDHYDLLLPQACIRKMYEWGVRKFSLHAPFGRNPRGIFGQTAGSSPAFIAGLTAAGNTWTAEPLVYDIDCYLNTRDGLVVDGRTGCLPMPWLTNDVVDGKVQGFVPLFRALTSGSSAGLPQDVWENLTGIGGPSAWFDPSDPIEITAYVGGMHNETYERWKVLVETNPRAFRSRLEESYRPYIRAGMRIGIDALAASPGATVGINAEMRDTFKTLPNGWFNASGVAQSQTTFQTPIWRNSISSTSGNLGYQINARTGTFAPPRDQNGLPVGTFGETFGVALDAGWWNFYQTWLVPQAGKNNIFVEAIPTTIEVDDVIYNHPYLGHPVISQEEYALAGFNSDPGLRHHFQKEHGPVEFRRYLFGTDPLIAVGVSSANGTPVARFDATFGFTYDKYWFLQPFAQNYNSDGVGTIPTGTQFPSGRGLAGSLTQPARSGIVYDYIRPGRVGGRDGAAVWGPYWLAEGLLNKPSQRNDPSTFAEDRTIPITVVSAPAFRELLPSDLVELKDAFGVTYDFARRFPNINSYAQYLAFLKKGGSKDPRFDFESTIKETVFGTTGERTLGVDLRGKARNLARNKNVSPIVFLTFAEYDAHTGSKLSGISGGVFYTPSLELDVSAEKIQSYLEYKYLEHYHRYGVYPEKFVWEFSKRDDTVDAFQVMRYINKPQNLPFTDADNANSYQNRDIRGYYDETAPIIQEVNAREFFQNVAEETGYPIPIFFNLENLYSTAKAIGVKILKTTKEWATLKGGPSVGLYAFPWLPLYGEHIYGITADSVAGDQGELVHINRWEDPLWKIAAPDTVFSPNGGTDIYDPVPLDEAETVDRKKRVMLEFRKRQEPFLEYLDFVFPEIADYSNKNMVGDYDYLHSQKARHERVLALAEEMTTLPRVSYLFNSSLGFDTLPAWTGGVMPTVSYHHVGEMDAGISHGDPKSTMFGSLFDHNQVNHELIDWVRDDWLRPAFRRSPRIRGMAVRNDAIDIISSAGESGSADALPYREQMLKWLQARDGLGATIDWGNSADALEKTQDYIQTHYDLTLRYLNRFNRGIPRIDIVNPYDWIPFAAGWGQTAGDAYPTEIEGVRITDVVPIIYTSDVNIRRSAGDTAGMDATRFNNLITRYNNAGVPAGRRVMLPQYWYTEPPSSQRNDPNSTRPDRGEDYYKNTSDGVTYTGSLPLLDHETAPVKLPSVFGYQSATEVHQSLTNFINQCREEGILFDYVGHDFESQSRFSVGGFETSFAGPFGPTGMPSEISGSNAVVPLQFFKAMPDPRIVHATVYDPRFAGLTLQHTGKSLADTIVDKYELYSSLRGNFSTISNNNFTVSGMTAGEILEYFYLEGPTGISAATGPAWVAAYGDQQPSGSIRTALQNASPFATPFGTRTGRQDRQNYQTLVSGGANRVNNYITWLAQAEALQDIIYGDLFKIAWKDTLQGSTYEDWRAIKFSNYNHSPMGATESSFLRDLNNHPLVFMAGDYGNVMHGYAPVLYGELNSSQRKGRYYTNPITEKQIHVFEQDGVNAGTVPFGSASPENLSTAPRSYIGFLKELGVLRAILRNNPNAWLRLYPWVTSPWAQNFEHGWRFDQTTSSSPTDPRYGKEIVYHSLLSGAEYLGYFYTFSGSANQSVTFHQSIKWMQERLNEWKTQSEGKRVQPCSNDAGDVNALVDRIVMKEAGAGHAEWDDNGKLIGGQGVVVSGARILDPENVGTTGTYLWRITVAPQVSKLIRVIGQEFTDDLPEEIEFDSFDESGDRGVWIKRTATSAMPKYRRAVPEEEAVPLAPARHSGDYAVFASLWNGESHLTQVVNSFNAAFPVAGYTSSGDPDYTIGAGWSFEGLTLAAIVPAPLDTATYTTIFSGSTYGVTHALPYSSVNVSNPEFIEYRSLPQNPTNGPNYSGNANGVNFNGNRRPDDFKTAGISDDTITKLKNKLNSIPPGRRAYRPYFHFKECAAEMRDRAYRDMFRPVSFNDSFSRVDPSSGTDWVSLIGLDQVINIGIGPGITYTYDTPSGPTTAIIYSPFYGDIGRSGSKHSIANLINRHRTAGVSFDWFILDHEYQGWWKIVYDAYNNYNQWGKGINSITNPPHPNLDYPNDPYFTPSQNRDDRPFRPMMPDARVASALLFSPRTDTYLHPVTGTTFGAEFVRNYQEISGDLSVTAGNWKDFLKPLFNFGITGVTAYGRTSNTVWTEFGNASSNGLIGLDRMANGFTFHEYAVPAWNAAIDHFYFGGELYAIYNRTYRDFGTEIETPESGLGAYKDVKVCQYDVSPVAPALVKFTSASNQEKYMQRPLPVDIDPFGNPIGNPTQASMGSRTYLKSGQNKILDLRLYPTVMRSVSVAVPPIAASYPFNVERLRDDPPLSPEALNPALGATLAYDGVTATYDTNWNNRSGWVRNPVDDREKFTWQGRFYPVYGGPAGADNLVKYPLESTKPYNTSGPTMVLIPDRIPEFYQQVCFKGMVNAVKELRLRHASDHTLWERWNNWISDPQWHDSDYAKGYTQDQPLPNTAQKKPYAEVGRCYYYENLYHEILHGIEMFQHWSTEPNTRGLAHLQRALDEWRRVSRNSRARPVDPEVGGIPTATSPISKVVMWEAMDHFLISGGKLLTPDLKGFGTDEVYIWRLTVGPHNFVNNRATLVRTDDTQDDIPQVIFINRFNPDGTENLLNGRGVWIVRLNDPNPPRYRLA